MAMPPERHDAPEGSGDIGQTLKFARLRMSAVVIAERLILLSAPLLGVLALFLILSWFGWFRLAPDWARILSGATLGAAGVVALWPLTRLRGASTAEIDVRLERENHVAHQAVAVQGDQIGSDSPFARALWQEHRRRMARNIGQLSSGVPRSDLPRRDPFGLRVAVALMLVTAFGYSFSGTAGRLTDVLLRHDVVPLPDVRIDAWVSPPSYVNTPPVFLTGTANLPDGPVRAIEGSEITVRLGGATLDARVVWRDLASGAADELTLADPQGVTAPRSDAAVSVYTFKPQGNGQLEVAAGASNRTWDIEIAQDTPPVLTFLGEPRTTVNGALELDYTVSDDHGVIRAEAEILPFDPPGPDARPLFEPPSYRLALPRRNALDNRATSSQDLTEHPLAGQKVAITLLGVDGAGQEGRSATVEIELPGRRFSEPLAAAVVEQRGLLALDANNLARTRELHAALMIAPEETIPNLTHFLLLQSVRGRLDNARSDDDLRAAIDYMWGVALQIEDGNLSLAERRLRDAQRQLSEALENGATDEEIARLMDELRDAMQDYLEQLARQQQNDPNAQTEQATPENTLRQQDLDNMLDQIENLARSGARDQAQQMLSELQRMMNNLQAGRQQQRQQQGGPMRQQMDKLGELMREQQQLMDETFRLDQQGENQQGDPGDPGDPQQGQNGQGQQPGQAPPSAQELQERQQALKEALEQLQKDLEAMGMNPAEGFGEAGEAMGDATGNLGEGQAGSALSDQGRAMQALRQGAQSMMNQMMQAMGQQPGEGEGQGPDRNGRGTRTADDRDPLGRPRATTGPDFGSRVEVPDEIDIQRAREILDAIRKRLGDQFSPEVEKRYLERLLDLQ